MKIIHTIVKLIGHSCFWLSRVCSPIHAVISVGSLIAIGCLMLPSLLFAATAPTISQLYPSKTISLNVGQTQQFNIQATTGSGMKGIEWFIGSESQKYTSYMENMTYYQQTIFTNKFNDVGTYYVYAYVYDRKSPQRNNYVTWTVNVQNPTNAIPFSKSSKRSFNRPINEFFDDFQYSGVDDPELSSFGWLVRKFPGGPGVVGAKWRSERISFLNNQEAVGDKLIRLTCLTKGAPDNTEHSEISTAARFFEGTYAMRVKLYDKTLYGPSNDGVIQAPLFTMDYLHHDNDPEYSELDFEYLPNDVWCGNTRSGPTIYCSSWETHTVSPWTANKDETALVQSFAGWQNLLMQVTDGEIKFFINGKLVATHGGPYYPESSMKIMIQMWFFGELSKEVSAREWAIDIDWVYHCKNACLSMNQVQAMVNTLRSNSVKRLDTFSTTTPPEVRTSIDESDGTLNIKKNQSK